MILGSNILSCQTSCISLITNHSRKPSASRSSNTMTPQARFWYQFQLASIFSIFAKFHSFPKRYEVCEPINLRLPLHLKFSESGCWSREKMPWEHNSTLQYAFGGGWRGQQWLNQFTDNICWIPLQLTNYSEISSHNTPKLHHPTPPTLKCAGHNNQYTEHYEHYAANWGASMQDSHLNKVTPLDEFC